MLRGNSLADPVAEVSPEEGNVFAFVRGENSWHGHTPFVGERRVVQVAWLRDAAARERKTRRGKLAWWLKGVFGQQGQGEGNLPRTPPVFSGLAGLTASIPQRGYFCRAR